VIGEDSLSKAQRKDMAKDFLIGEAIVHGTAIFYDFIDGENADKKAYVSNGTSCLCAGTPANTTEKLTNQLGGNEVRHVACLGRCADCSAFQIFTFQNSWSTVSPEMSPTSILSAQNIKWCRLVLN